LDRLHSFSGIGKDAKALDIGAGIGKCMKALEKAGFDVYGIEPSEPFYRMAVEKTGVNPEKLRREHVEDGSFAENSFDFITFGAVLEHLYDPSETIRKALVWSKPNGLIHIEVPSAHWLINKIANLYYRMIGTDYVVNLSPMHPPYHLYEFSVESFRRNALRNNYKIVHIEYSVCRTFMPKVLGAALKPIMKITNSGMQLCIWLAKK
jgi:2-polyprenyl-3-methyl-5-hydroxy-6-metoxy-1,4-benzoquinol methylase